MRWLIIIVTLLPGFYINAQPLTGTYLASYHRDKPGDKRIFYYRFYLKQTNDTLYGFCEAMDAQTDIKGEDPGNARVAERYEVYNHEVSATMQSAFQLHRGRMITTGQESFTKSNNSPAFLTLNCKEAPAGSAWRSGNFIVHSLLPAADGPTGDLLFKKISDSVPGAHWDRYMASVNENSHKPKEGFKLSSLFKRKKKTAAKEETVGSLPISERTEDLQATVQVTTDMARIALYDNGEIDNDSVSLYLNGQVLLSQRRLSAQPIQLEVKLDPTKENRFVLIAHNLGQIPPNTALLVVLTGTEQHQLTLSSSLQKNALVIMRVR